MRFRFPGVAVVALLAVLTCLFPASAQTPETIRLSAKPAAIFADGATTTTITAEVRDGGGGLIANGQTVRFSTTLGTIEAAAVTQGGQVSVKLTSSNTPGQATVTGVCGHATAELKVEFTSKPIVFENRAQAVSIRAKYLLYNQYENVVEATQNVSIRIGNLQITAERAQVSLDRSTVVAESQFGASALIVKLGMKSIAVDRFHYDWTSRVGMASGLNDPVRGIFDYNGYTGELKKSSGYAPPDEFQLAELVPSPLAIKASRIVYIPGTEIQFTRAEILLNNKHTISLPYHVIPVDSSSLEYAQYIGLGSRGFLLDIPYYLAANPIATSQFRVKLNAPEGLYGANVAGWALDWITKYDVGGGTNGSVALSRITSPDWGLSWSHNQDFDANTRGYFNLDTRSSSGVFQRYSLGNVSISHQAKDYSTTFTAFGSHTSLTTGDVDLSISSAPKPLPSGFSWTVGGSAARNWTASSFTDVANATVIKTTTEAVNVRLGAPTINLRDGIAINSSIGQGLTFGTGTARHSTLGTITANRMLGKGGSASLVYNYSDYGYRSTDSAAILQPEKQTITASLSYAKPPKWNANAFATIGVDQHSRNLRISGQYYISKVWWATLNAGYFQQGLSVRDPILDIINQTNFQAVNVEAKITRIVGERSLSLVYSTYQHKLYLDYVPGRYY